MAAETGLTTLGPEGLQRFQLLQSEAVNAVTKLFHATCGSSYERFGARGREACREDLASHLEFLRPVLEFGALQPMVDYLTWLSSVLMARSIPTDHVALSLEWLANFFAGRMDENEGRVVSDALHAARTEFLRAVTAPEASPCPPEHAEEQAVFLAALLAGRRRDALSVVDRWFDDGRSLVDLEQHLITPSLYQIGRKWQLNQVTVAQEHMATAIVQSVMTVGLMRSSPASLIGKSVLLACVEGNSHTIGLNMLSDAFQLDGWDVQYLGPNMPTSSLVEQIVESRPDLVGLSVSFPQQLPFVKAIVAQLNSRLGHSRPRVLIGGQAVNRFAPLAGAVDADAHMANAAEAVAYGNHSVERRVDA
jgi:methanogenic corrinoid protein MtbC1